MIKIVTCFVCKKKIRKYEKIIFGKETIKNICHDCLIEKLINKE